MGLPYGDPDELDRLAGVLRARADEVRRRADAQLTEAQAAQWVSISAAAYRDRLAERRAEAHQAADGLEQAADVLVAHAREVRERIAAIARVEEAVTGWFRRQAGEIGEIVDGVRAGVSQALSGEPPWAGWRFTPQTLPPPGDKGWLDVGEFMRGKGVL